MKPEHKIEDSPEVKLNIKLESKMEDPTDTKITTKMSEKRPAPERKKGGRPPRAKRSKTQREQEEQGCDCSDGHQSLLECEKEGKKVLGDVTTSIIVSSQGMAMVHVGGGGGRGSSKQSFVIHRELLMLHSGYFREMLKGKVKIEVKEDEEMKIKSEEIEAPVLGQEVATMSEARAEEALAMEHQGEDENKDEGVSEKSDREGEDGTGQQKERGDSTRESSLSDVPNRYESPEYESLEDLTTSSTYSNVITNQLKPENAPATLDTSTSTSSHQPPTRTTPSFTEIEVPAINPTQFTSFLSFIYTHTVSNSIAELQHASHPNVFPTLYLLGSQLGSPRFMNYIMTQHRRNWDRARPSPSQVQFIYSAIAAYRPLPIIPRESEKMDEIGEKGPKILKKFTAACLAASNPFMLYEEGDSRLEEWQKLFQERPEISLDIVKAGGRWHDSKPWEECWRKEWVVEERGLGERWEEFFVRGEEMRE